MKSNVWLRKFLESLAMEAAPEPLDLTGKLTTFVELLSDLEWLLVISSVETELKVHVPYKLASNRSISLADFIARVADLPKVENPFWNLNRFGALATTLLDLAEPQAQVAPTAKKKSEVSKQVAKKNKPLAATAKTPRAAPRKNVKPESPKPSAPKR